MIKTILLTGATGFLGSHLLEALLKNDYNVVILKRSFSDTWRINHLLDKVVSYDLDRQPTEMAFKDQKVDVIIHLATLYRKFDDGSDVSKMMAANVTFPTWLLESGISHGVKGFINTGTFFECDCSILPLSEGAPHKPFNLYAKTKLAFETILETYTGRLATITMRLFSPYGEKDNNKLIPLLIKNALKSETVELSDGLQKLDFIYAKDIIHAYLKALQKILNSEKTHRIYNIGSGCCLSIREVVSILEQQLGFTINKQWGSPATLDIPIVFADIELAKKELGWAPRFSIHEGLAKTLKNYKEEMKL